MNLLKTIVKLVLTLICSMFVGTFLLYLVFLLPTEGIFQHVREDGRVFSIEGTYPVMDGTNATILDNWTDSLMLENAFFEKEGAGTLEKALGIYRPEFEDGVPTNSLLRYLNGQGGYQTPSYARYWHGYLVVLKPLLTITDYLGIRSLNRIFQTVLVLAAAVILWRKLSLRYIIPLAAAYLFLRPAAVAFSMQFSAVFYISILAVMIMALFYNRLVKGNNFLYFFLLTGIVTNFVDFLTYPIATLGLPLALWLCFERERSCAGKIRHVIGYSACWGSGYFGMWIGKWIIGSVLLKRNVLADALEQARTRTSAEIGQEAITRGAVIMRNLHTGFENWVWLAAIVFAAVILIGMLRTKMNMKELFLQSIPFLIVGVMPILWYSILSNHSFIHHWFTYRALSVSVFAVLGMGMSYCLPTIPVDQIKST